VSVGPGRVATEYDFLLWFQIVQGRSSLVSAFEVSAFEPAPPAEPKLDLPQFLIVLRGFDRGQVEAWGRELASQVQQERLRADQAEQALYRMQLQQPATPSFTQVGARVGDALEEASRSAQKLLVDAAEWSQEAVDAADAEATQRIAAAERRVAEIERAAHQLLDQARAEAALVEGEARQVAAALHAQAEQDARAVLGEVRHAADRLWQEAELKRAAVEADTRRLQALRRRAGEQLVRTSGHLGSILAGLGRGIDGLPDAGEAEPKAAAEPATRQPAVAVEPTEAGSRKGLRPLEPVAAAPAMG